MTTEHNAESASPRRAVLSNEDPAAFDRLVDDLRAVYLPLNTVAVSVVDDIAIARWQILRFDSLLARQWEISLTANPPPAVFAAIYRFNRQIDQLNVRIARLERRLKFIRANFPQESPLPVEDTTTDGQNNPKTEEPIVIRDFCPETIAFLRRHHPASPIIISPVEAVPKSPLF